MVPVVCGALVLVLGCGRIGFELTGASTSSNDASRLDAIGLPTCAVGCAMTEFCASPAFSCGGAGSCVTTPTSCPPTDDPVCGCDGQTYLNECEASRLRVSVSLAGACPSVANPTCTPACGGTEFCSTPDGVCNLQPGVCLPKPAPMDCDIPLEVCGCDGLAYPNPCEAAIAGASIYQPGTCN